MKYSWKYLMCLGSFFHMAKGDWSFSISILKCFQTLSNKFFITDYIDAYRKQEN